MRLLSSFRRGRNGRPVRLGALAVLAVLAALSACSSGRGERATTGTRPTAARVPIHLDGHFDDWTRVPVWSQAAASSGPLEAAWATDDAQWWYLSFSVRDSVSQSGMPGTLHLLIDADDRTNTGGTVFDAAVGLAGVDVALDLSRSDKTQGNGVGAGADGDGRVSVRVQALLERDGAGPLGGAVRSVVVDGDVSMQQHHGAVV